MALPAGGPRNKGRFEARDALGMASRVAWLSRRGSHLASCWEEPIPRGQGCPAQGLQTPQGVGGVGGSIALGETLHRNAMSFTAQFYCLDTKTHSPG